MSTAGTPRDDPPDDAPTDGPAPWGGLLGGTTRLSLFGEVGLVGVVVAVLSLPVVTAVPALAAGTLHLRRHLSGEAASLGRLLRSVGPALRDLWALALLVPFVLTVAAVNLWLVAGTSLAGGAVIGAVSVAVGLVAVVVTLRTAGTWHPGAGGPGAVLAAAHRARRDVPGSVLLLLAAALCVALVWALEAFALLVGGLLALAAVTVEHRWAERAGTSPAVDR
ncbi:hypothetical protein [Cellulomonas aerilata]|uniref:hypothetical protein n=1 Tax=Cellulomonas aerilata TaxID=515326 RepID=UPI0011BDFDDA|nr:hypothetical protein [Cellulomonas aerilata]